MAACGKSGDAKSRPPVATTAFNADSAMSYVRQQVAFGPSIPGTDAARRAGDWIVAHLRITADTVIEQRWAQTLTKGGTLPLRNILARFRPADTVRVLYVSHWDTRPHADDDPDPAKRKLPMPGANDPESSVALLLAISDALKKTPPHVGVDLLFTDGEDWGDFTPDRDVLMGSTYFAQHLPSTNYKPIFGVLWDMIGAADLRIYQEVNSVNTAPDVVRRVWEQARDFGYDRYFIPEAKYPMDDDHMPLIKAGLHVIDVIGWPYGPLDAQGNADPNYHHTSMDTIDKLSAKSLKIVGDVALALVR
jgi:glutaminyl-peptide cyclotransferase